MRIVKAIFAVVLLLVALAGTVGEFFALYDPSAMKASDDGDPFGDPHIPWHEHASTILAVGFCVCASYLLLRRVPSVTEGLHCPHCGVEGDHAVTHSLRRSTSPRAWHFGGFLLSVLWAGSRAQRFRCLQCGELFSSDTHASKGYRLLFLLLLAIIVFGMYGEFASP